MGILDGFICLARNQLFDGGKGMLIGFWISLPTWDGLEIKYLIVYDHECIQGSNFPK